MLGLLHVYGLAFLVLAIVKPLFPRNVGLFIGPGRLTFGAIFGSDLEQVTEVLGWWGIPVFVAVGAIALWSANWLLRALGRWRLGRLRAARPR